MTTEQFAYWLGGFSEICNKCPDEKQWAMIQEHLESCFVKTTKLTMKEPSNFFSLPDLPMLDAKNIILSGGKVFTAGSSLEAEGAGCYSPQIRLTLPSGDNLPMTNIVYRTC